MAKSVKALITPDVLKWAREEYIRLELPEAANLIKVSQEKLEKWEHGDEKPTIRQLKDIAKTYNLHITVFYLPEPPKGFPMPVDHRVPARSKEIDEKQSYRLKVNITEAYKRRELLIYLYELLEWVPQKVPLKIDSKDTHNTAAQKIKQFLEYNPEELPRTKDHSKAYKFWKKLVESKGILVCQTVSRLPMDLETVRGFCIAQNPFPTIVINSKDSVLGKIFTIFHELVHIGLGHSAIQNTNLEEVNTPDLKKIEVFCNYVAGETLVPKDELLRIINIETLEEDLPEIRKHFQASSEVIMRRLLIHDKISNKRYQKFREEQQKKYNQQNNKYGPPPHARLLNVSGELFARTAFSAYYEEQITMSELSSFFSNCDTKHLTKIERSIFARTHSLIMTR